MIITDILLDPRCLDADCDAVLTHAAKHGVRIWLSSACVAEYHVPLRQTALKRHADRLQWLSALACDVAGDLGGDPLTTLLERSARRLGKGTLVISDRVDQPSGMKAGAFAATAIDPQAIAFIDLASQQDRIRPELERRLHHVLRSGHYIMGPEIEELEKLLAAYVGAKHAISAASGTDTLEIALRALGVGHGDEVVTTPFTWISTAETIAQVGAIPIFADIDPVTFNIDTQALEAAITPRTKALMPVSLFGQMARTEEINRIAAKHGLPVIEDAAQSFGATRNGVRSCAATLIGSTSFFPAKPLGCYGDGGALFTSDDALAAKMRAIRTHGGEKRHHHPYVGMNGRLDTMQAAVLLAKFPHWDGEVAKRNALGAAFSARLARFCMTPAIDPGNTHVYAQYTVRVRERDKVAEKLKAQGIPSAVYYPKCLHEQPVFQDGKPIVGRFPHAEQASREVLSLPMHPDLDERTMDRIVSGFARAVTNA